MNDAIWLGFKFGLVGTVLQMVWHLYSHGWPWIASQSGTFLVAYIGGGLVMGTILPFILGFLVALCWAGIKRLSKKQISN